MRKIATALTALGLSLMLGSSALAAVTGVHEEKTNWKLDYPVVTVDGNAVAQNTINNAIEAPINVLRNDFDRGVYYTCGGYYRVHYEDDSVLSVSLYLYRYPMGGCGNRVKSFDYVFDKRTGERIPLYNYVKLTPEDLKTNAYYKAYDEKGNPIGIRRVDIKEIPENYFLEGNGVVCIVFQPYVLAAGYKGCCYLELSPEFIDYMNRKNQW